MDWGGDRVLAQDVMGLDDSTRIMSHRLRFDALYLWHRDHARSGNQT